MSARSRIRLEECRAATRYRSSTTIDHGLLLQFFLYILHTHTHTHAQTHIYIHFSSFRPTLSLCYLPSHVTFRVPSSTVGASAKATLSFRNHVLFHQSPKTSVTHVAKSITSFSSVPSSRQVLRIERYIKRYFKDLFLFFVVSTGVLAIQNDPTSSRQSQDDLVLSASSYTGPERTSSSGQRDETLHFQTSFPALQLESSKSVADRDRDETPFTFRVTSPDETIDVLTPSKHVDHIEGNNIEVKPGEYYR